MKIYQLESENLTNLGGPMGTESTSTNWIKPFESLEAAQAYAEQDYDGDETIKWKKDGKLCHSQDLGYVMYNITEQELGTLQQYPPKMISDEKLDLKVLKNTMQEYMDYVASDKYHEDNDWDHFIYEAAVKAFFGDGAFSYINKRLR